MKWFLRCCQVSSLGQLLRNRTHHLRLRRREHLRRVGQLRFRVKQWLPVFDLLIAVIDERQCRPGRRISAVTGRGQTRAVGATRLQHWLVRWAIFVGFVRSVKTSARLAQILRNFSHSGIADDVPDLSQPSVADDVEQVLLAILHELLVDELSVLESTLTVEAKLCESNSSNDDRADPNTDKNAENVVLVHRWIDDSLTDDVNQIFAEFIEPFFEPDQRQDRILDLSIKINIVQVWNMTK